MFRLTNEPSSGGHNCLFSELVHMLVLCRGIWSTSDLTNLILFYHSVNRYVLKTLPIGYALYYCITYTLIIVCSVL
jgi:hypothetical protein